MTTSHINNHDIELDELLHDAETELRSTEMFSLARAVGIARTRLMGTGEREEPKSGVHLAAVHQLPLPLSAIGGE